MAPYDASSLYPNATVDVERETADSEGNEVTDHIQGRVVEVVQGSQGQLVILDTGDGVRFIPQSELVEAIQAAPDPEPEARRPAPAPTPAPAPPAQGEAAADRPVPPTGTGTEVPEPAPPATQE